MQQHDFQQRLFSHFERLQMIELFYFVIFAKLVTKFKELTIAWLLQSDLNPA